MDISTKVFIIIMIAFVASMVVDLTVYTNFTQQRADAFTQKLKSQGITIIIISSNSFPTLDVNETTFLAKAHESGFVYSAGVTFYTFNAAQTFMWRYAV